MAAPPPPVLDDALDHQLIEQARPALEEGATGEEWQVFHAAWDAARAALPPGALTPEALAPEASAPDA